MQSCCTLPETQRAPAVRVCPSCGQRAKRVERITLEHLLRLDSVSRIGNAQYYFCEMTTCPVVYFPYDAGGAVFHKPDLRVRVGLKETEDPVPVCYCFDLSRKEIWDEIEKTGGSTAVSRVKAVVQAGNCACEVKSPSGKCCLGDATRVVQERLRTIAALAGSAEPPDRKPEVRPPGAFSSRKGE